MQIIRDKFNKELYALEAKEQFQMPRARQRTGRIVLWPAKALNTRVPETNIDARMNDILDDAAMMIDAIRQLGGIGIAAPQVGSDLRMIAATLDDLNGAWVNPSWRPADGAELVDSPEGCLSVAANEPIVVQRYDRIVATGWPALPRFEYLNVELTGTAAACWQHECDHLDGRTIADGLSPLRKDIIQRRAKKAQRR